MAQTYPTVQPGDLIKAELINQIIADLELIKTKLAQLENTGQTTGAPAIDSLVPPTEVRMGERLQILGRNFGDPNKVTVVIANELVEKRDIDLANSGDRLLVVTTPAILGIGSEGKEAPVVVSNARGSATTSIVLKPGDASELVGTLTVNPATPPTAAVTANASFEWTVPVRVISTLPAAYILSATVDQPGWKVEFLDVPSAVSQGNLAVAEQSFPKSPPDRPTDRSYKVRVSIPAGVADGTVGSLDFNIKARDRQTFANSRITTITVGGVQPLPSTDIVLSTGLVIPPTAMQDGFIEVAEGSMVIVKFNIVVTRAGNYVLKKFEAIDDATNKWTPRIATSMTNNTFMIPAAGQPFTLDTTLSAQAGAPQTRLRLQISNQEETLSGLFEQPIRLKQA